MVSSESVHRMSKRGEKMRTEVLGVRRRHRSPMSAYEVLGRLRQGKPRLAPPTIFRSLATLTERGRVHRFRSLNAFMACKGDHRRHASILAICDDGGSVGETLSPGLLDTLSGIAGRSGFAPTRHVIEAHGQWANCRATRACA